MPIASSNPVPFLAIVPALFPPEKFWHGCPLRRPLYSEAGRLSPRCAESLRVDRPERAGKRQQALVSFPLPPLRKINDGSCVRATALWLCITLWYQTRPYLYGICVRPSRFCAVFFWFSLFVHFLWGTRCVAICPGMQRDTSLPWLSRSSRHRDSRLRLKPTGEDHRMVRNFGQHTDEHHRNCS